MWKNLKNRSDDDDDDDDVGGGDDYYDRGGFMLHLLKVKF